MRLTAERVRELFTYDPETGELRNRVARAHRVKAGSLVSHITFQGYLSTQINYIKYPVTHIIWLYMTGYFPKFIIDHKNLDKLDNRWCNLREATYSQNLANKRACGVSRYKGAYWNGRRYIALIKISGRTVYLGSFITAKEAARAYDVAASSLFGEFARLNFPKE